MFSTNIFGQANARECRVQALGRPILFEQLEHHLAALREAALDELAKDGLDLFREQGRLASNEFDAC